MENSLEKPRSSQENDQVTRSNKKPKRKITNYIFERREPHDEQMQDVEILQPLGESHTAKEKDTNISPGRLQNMSFRDMVRGEQNVNVSLAATHAEDNTEDDEVSDDDSPPEDYIDNDRCPVILLSKEEKKALRKPWRNSLIIKMFD